LGDGLIELAAHGVGLQGSHDTQRGFYLRPRNQIGKIPPLTVAVSPLALLRRHVREQAGDVLVEIPPFVFEHDQDEFAPVDQEVEEGGCGV
jgi:hypothetical protein